MLDDEWASARMLESKWERESREFSGLANRWQIDRKHVCSCVSRCHFSSYFCQLKKQFANLSLTSVAATVVPFMEHLIPVVQKPRRKKPATEFASAAVASYSSSIGTWSNRWWRRTYIRETQCTSLLLSSEGNRSKTSLLLPSCSSFLIAYFFQCQTFSIFGLTVLEYLLQLGTASESYKQTTTSHYYFTERKKL